MHGIWKEKHPMYFRFVLLSHPTHPIANPSSVAKCEAGAAGVIFWAWLVFLSAKPVGSDKRLVKHCAQGLQPVHFLWWRCSSWRH